MIVSGEHWRDLAMHMQVSIFLQTPLPSRLPCNTELSSMCYTVGLCWLSILNITLLTWPSLIPCHFWFYLFKSYFSLAGLAKAVTVHSGKDLAVTWLPPKNALKVVRNSIAFAVKFMTMCTECFLPFDSGFSCCINSSLTGPCRKSFPSDFYLLVHFIWFTVAQ